MSDTGSPKERELRSQLNEEDNIFCIRLAASGGGTSDALPDLLYWIQTTSGEIYAVAGEMKYAEHGTERKYIDSSELDDLFTFCEYTGAIPVAIHRWAGDTNFYVIPLRPLTESDYTRTGNLSLSRETRQDSMEITQYNRILEKS